MEFIYLYSDNVAFEQVDLTKQFGDKIKYKYKKSNDERYKTNLKAALI